MRASWLVDAKWVAGLLCLFCALGAGLLYSLTAVTGRDTATGIFIAAIGGTVNSQLSDEEYAALSAAAAADPDADFTVGRTTLTVKGSEIAGLTKDQAVKLVISRIAVVHFEQGPDAAEALITAEGEDGKEFSIGPVRPLTKQTHDAVQPWFTGFAAAALVLAAPLVFFSRRFGRLGSPGIVLAIASAPYALVWRLVDSKAAGVTEETGVFASALAAAVRGPASDLGSAFARLLFTGVGMVGLAIGGHITWPWALKAYRRWLAPRIAARTPAA